MNKFIQRQTLLIVGILILLLGGIFLFSQFKNSPTVGFLPQQGENADRQGPQNNESQDFSFIAQLRNRTYEGSRITIEQTLSENSAYTSYEISYLSDNLKIYGVMNVPNGKDPFPVIIMNHGYFNQSTFVSGNGTQNMADILAREGYLTLASDYRGFGQSEDSQGSSRGGHRPDYAIDVLNLIASIKNMDKADPSRIGMWGHSMGGEISLRTAEATDRLKAIVLWAPTSANASDNAAFYGRRRHTGTPPPVQDRDTQGTSPINYLQYINTPISLHQGLSDTEVNPQWSKNLSDALKKERKEVEYFEYHGQDHNFQNLGWGVIAPRAVAFFDKYLK